MTAIQRNNALLQNTREVSLRGGGSGRGAGVARRDKVQRRLRFPADPAAELMPSAEFLGTEPDFQAILEDFRDGPLDPSRRRILGRLMGMFAMDYQGARSEERRFLRRLLMGRNAREGYAANRALHLCQIPHVIRRTLSLGVAESRFATGPLSGFIGAVQARNAAITFMLLGPAARERVWNALTRAGAHDKIGPLKNADRLVERVLILKALAARRHLLGPWSIVGPTALDEVIAFADDIRCNSRSHLALTTTLERPKDGVTLPLPAKVPAEPVGRLTAMARATIDPVYAWRLHGGAQQVVTDEPWSATGSDDALPDLDRSPLLDRTRLHQALAEARQLGDELLPLAASDALAAHLGGKDLKGTEAAAKDEALGVLQNRGFDVTRLEAIEAIRDDAKGIYRYDAARAFSMLVSRFTGATYVRRVFSDQLTAGADPIQQIDRALEQGFVVPTVLSELRKTTVRTLLIVGARGDAAGKPQLIVQPISGELIVLPAKSILEPVLPEQLGTRARADAYLAPAALDLLAPPFGIIFSEIGIEDRL
ncbi:MAG TPA: hypothetical protein VLC93_09700 [Myxococcota bacterium]|nr:hypothetical protein [Myxococcota bacterium]